MKPFFLTFSMILFAAFCEVEGQVLGDIGLEPPKLVEQTVPTDSCVILVRDFRTTITLPLGKTLDWIIPAGTAYRVPAGKYLVENHSTSTLEFKLTSIDKCPH